jgi:hypothetical protein
VGYYALIVYVLAVGGTALCWLSAQEERLIKAYRLSHIQGDATQAAVYMELTAGKGEPLLPPDEESKHNDNI